MSDDKGPRGNHDPIIQQPPPRPDGDPPEENYINIKMAKALPDQSIAGDQRMTWGYKIFKLDEGGACMCTEDVIEWIDGKPEFSQPWKQNCSTGTYKFRIKQSKSEQYLILFHAEGRRGNARVTRATHVARIVSPPD